MALVKPILFQIVGYKNSGKTTFVAELIKTLKAEAVNVVTIKHHGHGGKPEAISNKDSSTHLHAGALASIVEGDGGLLLQAEKALWTLEEKIQLISFFSPDIILIEGHKEQCFPKLLLLRNDDDLELLKRLDNIKIVITWDKTLIAKKDFLGVPCFHIGDRNGIDWTTDYLKSQLMKNSMQLTKKGDKNVTKVTPFSNN